MPPRSTLTAPEFGKWLKAQRGAKDYSLEEFAIQLRVRADQFGLRKVSRTTLQRYEDGRIPSWQMLYAMSDVLQRSPVELATRLCRVIKITGRSDLLCQLADPQSALLLGGADDPTVATRVLDERDARIRALEDALETASALAAKLIDVIAIGVEGHEASGGPSKRGRRTGAHR